MTFARLVDTSRRVAETSGRRAKIALLAELLRTLPPEEIEIAVAYLSGTVLQARLGVGWATIQAALPGSAAEAPSVTLTEVDQSLSRTMQASGAGSAAERQRLLRELFVRLTRAEQQFLGGLLVGELRQGALEGLVLEAVAQAAGLPARELRRAAMMAGGAPPPARGGAPGGGGAGGGVPAGARPPGAAARRGRRGAQGRSGSVECLRRAALPSGAADAGRHRRERGRGGGRAGRVRTGAQARRRASADPPPGR